YIISSAVSTTCSHNLSVIIQLPCQGDLPRSHLVLLPDRTSTLPSSRPPSSVLTTLDDLSSASALAKSNLHTIPRTGMYPQKDEVSLNTALNRVLGHSHADLSRQLQKAWDMNTARDSDEGCHSASSRRASCNSEEEGSVWDFVNPAFQNSCQQGGINVSIHSVVSYKTPEKAQMSPSRSEHALPIPPTPPTPKMMEEDLLRAEER
ncbi:unnamed protein product, partial [Meganyctiphanes norvegica]